MARLNTTARRWTVALSLAALVWMFALAPFAAPSRSLRYRMAPDQLDAFTFELRQEVTTEGGLNVRAEMARLAACIPLLQEAGGMMQERRQR